MTLDQERFSMMVAESECCSCHRPLAPGDLVRMKPHPKSNGGFFMPQCGPCAKVELLPLWREHEEQVMRRFAEEQAEEARAAAAP